MKRIKCLFSLCLTYQNCVIMFFIYIVSYLSSAKVFLMLVAFNCNLPNCLCVSCNSIDVIFWIFFYSLIAFMWQIFMLYNYSLQFTCIGMTCLSWRSETNWFYHIINTFLSVFINSFHLFHSNILQCLQLFCNSGLKYGWTHLRPMFHLHKDQSINLHHI